MSRLAFSALLAVPLALLALAPLAGRAAAQTAHAAANGIGKSSGPAVDLTLHYHSALAGVNQPGRMATDAQGNVYVSDANLNRVLEFDANDNFVRYYGTGSVGTGHGNFSGPAGIAVGGGFVYVVDTGNHEIQVFQQSNAAYSTEIGYVNLTAPEGIALASNGYLYVADRGANDISEFTTGGSYIYSYGSYGSGPGQFNSPVDIAASPLGYLYVVDLANTRVQQLTLAPGYVSQWGHNTFSTPDGIAVDRSGMVYVTDRGANTVYKFDPGGSLVGSYAAPATAPFVQGTFVTLADVAVRNVANQPIAVYVSDQSAGVVQRFDQVLNPQLHTYQAHWGGTASGTGNGQFNFPEGVVVDNAGNVYVADSGNDRIEKFDQFGNFLLSFGGHGNGNGQLYNPAGLAISPDGSTLYVADRYNNRIEEFSPSGAYLGQFNSGGSFFYPSGIATDGSFLYVTDSNNGRIQVFDTSGNFLYQFGSTGNGTLQFSGPDGIAVDIARQELFIADYGNNRVQVYTTSGNYVTSLTSASFGGFGGFSLPAGVFTDQRGDVYVADSTHSQIVEFDVNLTHVTTFGTYGNMNGQLNDPFGVAVSPTNGQIYVADAQNNRVQRFGSPWPKNDTVGIYRPSTKTFYLRNENSTGSADITVYMPYAQTGDIPVVGDWNGDGVDTVGLYRPSKARFLLQDSNTQESAPDYVFTLGLPGDTPIAGDWNGQGADGAGIFRPSNGILYLKNSLSTGVADYNLVLGKPGDIGISGDWNGDGQDSPGVYRPSNERFYVTNKVTDGVVFSDASAVLGISGDVPFTGDWIAQGFSGIGVFRPTNGVTYEKNVIVTGPADNAFIYGIAGDIPVAGQWVSPSVPFSTPAPHTSLGTRTGGTTSHPDSGGGSHPASSGQASAAATLRRKAAIMG